MTRIVHSPVSALICALGLLLLECNLALGAGPAPATNPTTANTPISQSAIEREPIRRGADAQKSPTTAATSADARNRPNPSATVDLQRVGLSLALVLGVIFIARIATKKLFPAVSVGRNSQIIRVVSRSVIGPKQQFLLVKLGKRLVLIGDSGTSMNSLAEITDPDEVAELVGQLQSESNHSSTGAFASMFRKAETQFQSDDEEALAPVPTTTSQAARRELLLDEEESESDGGDIATDVDQGPPDRKLVAAASEINGLMDRVRLLSNRLRGS